MAADLGNIPLNQDNHNGDDVNAGEKHMSQEGNQRRGSDPEVIPIAQQRQYTAEYKRRVLQEYEACPEPGEKEALLHREGLYTSHITTWQRQRERGELAGLTTKKRGPKADLQEDVYEEPIELLRRYMHLFWHWAWLMVLVTIVGGGGAFLFFRQQQPV